MKYGIAVAVILLGLGNTSAGEWKQIPIQPSSTATFFFFCQQVHADSQSLSSARANTDQALLRRNIVERYTSGDESDWRTLVTVTESVLKEIASLSQSKTPSAEKPRETVLANGLRVLRASLSTSGLKAVEREMNGIRSSITGVRLTYVP